MEGLVLSLQREASRIAHRSDVSVRQTRHGLGPAGQQSQAGSSTSPSEASPMTGPTGDVRGLRALALLRS
jgi:hypothetical protein